MRESEVIINESICMGCAYCVEFCPRGCIEISKEKFSPIGYPLAVLVHPEKCTACGTCARMCPQYAITVYSIEAEAV